MGRPLSRVSGEFLSPGVDKPKVVSHNGDMSNTHRIATEASRYPGEGRAISTDITFTYEGARNPINHFCYSDGSAPYNLEVSPGVTVRTTGQPNLSFFGAATVISAHPEKPKPAPIVIASGDFIVLDDGQWFRFEQRGPFKHATPRFQPLGIVESGPNRVQW